MIFRSNSPRWSQRGAENVYGRQSSLHLKLINNKSDSLYYPFRNTNILLIRKIYSFFCYHSFRVLFPAQVVRLFLSFVSNTLPNPSEWAKINWKTLRGMNFIILESFNIYKFILSGRADRLFLSLLCRVIKRRFLLLWIYGVRCLAISTFNIHPPTFTGFNHILSLFPYKKKRTISIKKPKK